MPKATIGFIGLGNMGAPMAGHLLDAGVPLVVYDVRAEAVEVIAASSGRSNASDLKFPRFILNGRFDSGFALALMREDVDGFLRLADEVGSDPPVAAAAAEYFRRAMATPLASADHTEVVTLLGEGFARAKESQA